jgi:hypothetical protein
MDTRASRQATADSLTGGEGHAAYASDGDRALTSALRDKAIDRPLHKTGKDGQPGGNKGLPTVARGFVVRQSVTIARSASPERKPTMQRLVTTTFLDMTRRDALRPAWTSPTPFQLVQVEIPRLKLNRFLYTAVGAHWWWYSRLSWDDARWRVYLDRPELETWVAYVSGTPAGSFELERQHDTAVELASFSLLPRFIGKGRWHPSDGRHHPGLGDGSPACVAPYLPLRPSSGPRERPSPWVSDRSERGDG